MATKTLTLALACAAALACGPATHPEILVVVDGGSALSRAIGAYYCEQRGVPPSQLLELSLPGAPPEEGVRAAETIDRETFERHVRDPIASFLTEHGLIEEIEIIVTTKGVPLRVSGPTVPIGSSYLELTTAAAVDAELALLFSGLDGSPGIEGMTNPYFDSDEPFRRFRRENPDAPLRYLVARLDGYQEPVDPETGVPVDVKALIDRARGEFPESQDRIWLIDSDPEIPPGRGPGNTVMLASAAGALEALEQKVFHARIPGFRGDLRNMVGYASWGSNDTHSARRPYYGEIDGHLIPGSFAPRALAVDLVSTNARSFLAPPEYGQSLTADLVRLGVAGAAGNVYEPVLNTIARPRILLRNYARGVPAIEAYFRSVPYLGWMSVYVGDPLMQMERPSRALPNDRDGDGVPDAGDNCLAIPNPDQRDTDDDDFGNFCDGDFDGDGIVSTTWNTWPSGDLEEMTLRIKQQRYDPHYDLNGDGSVDANDSTLLMLSLFYPPGPSGRVTPDG